MKHQLDNAIVTQRRQGDDLGRSGHDDPSDRAGQDFFDVHGMQMTRNLILAPFVFQYSNSIAVFVKP